MGLLTQVTVPVIFTKLITIMTINTIMALQAIRIIILSQGMVLEIAVETLEEYYNLTILASIIMEIISMVTMYCEHLQVNISLEQIQLSRELARLVKVHKMHLQILEG